MTNTKKEQNAINSLKRLAKRWPDSLWLFCDGRIHVMKYKTKRERGVTTGGSMDPDYVLATIEGIEADGGTW